MTMRDIRAYSGRRKLLVTAGVALTCLFLFWSAISWDSPNGVPALVTTSRFWSEKDARAFDAANTTLGFQAVLALTRNTPWRIVGLDAAANLTDIDIETPVQTSFSDQELDDFLNLPGKDVPHAGAGTATVWMQHIQLLRLVVERGYDTALILEDDVDWDINIKQQMMHVSKGVRDLLGDGIVRHYTSGDSGSVKVGKRDRKEKTPPYKKTLHYGPYGHAWDVLWLGNCGDNVGLDAQPEHHWVSSDRVRMWRDFSVVPHKKYTGWSHNAVTSLPSGSRALMLSRGPICTYAYAVTLSGARRLLSHVEKGGLDAYDIRLSQLCGQGRLKCVTAVPELFHAYEPPASDDGTTVSETAAMNGQGTLAVDVLQRGMGHTINIFRSARCKALYNKSCFPGRLDG